jgi:hypothetical protein
VTIHFSSAADAGARVADALEAYDTSVRLAVLCAFCRTCGERECRRHS